MTEVWHAVSSDIYAKAREKSTASAGAPGAESQEPAAEAKSEKKEGDVVDADFEMVDDDKKK